MGRRHATPQKPGRKYQQKSEVLLDLFWQMFTPSKIEVFLVLGIMCLYVFCSVLPCWCTLHSDVVYTVASLDGSIKAAQKSLHASLYATVETPLVLNFGETAT